MKQNQFLIPLNLQHFAEGEEGIPEVATPPAPFEFPEGLSIGNIQIKSLEDLQKGIEAHKNLEAHSTKTSQELAELKKQREANPTATTTPPTTEVPPPKEEPKVEVKKEPWEVEREEALKITENVSRTNNAIGTLRGLNADNKVILNFIDSEEGKAFIYDLIEENDGKITKATIAEKVLVKANSTLMASEEFKKFQEWQNKTKEEEEFKKAAADRYNQSGSFLEGQGNVNYEGMKKEIDNAVDAFKQSEEFKTMNIHQRKKKINDLMSNIENKHRLTKK